MTCSPITSRAFGKVLVIAFLAGVVAGAVHAFGQPTTAVFDAADVHASPRRSASERPSFRLARGRYQVRNATLVDLIATAYGVRTEAVVGGPPWLELDRFDILASVRGQGPMSDAKPMLASLLADRFGLVVRHQESDIPAVALVAAGNPRLRRPRGGGESGCTVTLGRRLEMIAACRSATTGMLAAELTRMNGGYFTTPLADKTGLMGPWDLDLTWAQRGMLEQSPQPSDPSLWEALGAVGLALERGAMRAPAVVVERVNRTPTPNAPDVATKLRSGPVRFDVATIKLAAPDGNASSTWAPGRVSLGEVTLRGLIMTAWDVPSQDHLVAPARLAARRFDVVAQYDASEGVLDQDGVRPLLRALIEERFRVRTRNEVRPVPVTVLTSSRHKLTPADPGRRSTCTAAISDDDLRRRVAGVRRLTCQHMTMTEFARQLPSFGARTTLVLDETGLEGAWDFSVVYSPGASSQAAQAWRGVVAEGVERPTGSAASAAEPALGLTFAEALERQLGLVLTIEKRPGAVLVVDAADEMPTEN